MAKAKEMTFFKSLKMSHNYNSFEVGYGLTVELENGDITSEVKQNAWNTVDAELDVQVLQVIETLAKLSD